MIRDSQTMLAIAQAITATAVSEHVFDAGANGIDLGAGNAVPFTVHANAAFATCTSLQIQIIGSANADLSSPTVVEQSRVILLADLTADTKLWSGNIDSLGNKDRLRYWGFNFVVAGSNATAGTVTAQIGAQNYDHADFPSGFTV